MLIWNAERIAREHPGETKIQCRCALCGPVAYRTPLVRFDRVRLDEQPDQGYPRVGVCAGCVARALHTIDQKSAEAGMVRIGSTYRCSSCCTYAKPVIWLAVQVVQEQYVCAACLHEAHHKLLAEQDLQVVY